MVHQLGQLWRVAVLKRTENLPDIFAPDTLKRKTFQCFHPGGAQTEVPNYRRILMKRTYLFVLSLVIVVIFCLAPVAASAQTVPNWAPNTAYAAGALVMFNGQEFKCIQPHTSQVGWEPPNVPALWALVSG